MTKTKSRKFFLPEGVQGAIVWLKKGMGEDSLHVLPLLHLKIKLLIIGPVKVFFTKIGIFQFNRTLIFNLLKRGLQSATMEELTINSKLVPDVNLTF